MKSFQIKKTVLIFFFLYAIMPSLAGIRISQNIPALTFHRILIILLILILINKNLLKIYISTFFKSRIFTFPIILVFFSMILSSLQSENVSGSLSFVLSYIFDEVFISIIIFSVFETREDIELLINTLCKSALVLTLFCVCEKITSYNPYWIFGVYDPMFDDLLSHSTRSGSIRIFASFSDPIALSAYFALILPLFLYLYQNKFIKIIFFSVVIFTITTWTQSRAGQIGVIIGFSFYLIFIENNRLRFLFPSIIPFISGSFRYRLKTLNPFFTDDEVLAASSTERSRQMDHLLPYIYEKFIFGYGIIQPPALERGINNYQNSIDNYYLIYTFSFGIFGLFTWIFLMLSVIFKPIKYFKNDFKNDKLVLSLISIVIIYCVINIIVSMWSYHFMFWIVVGILARLIHNKRNTQYV